jgi:hypothetical protein
MPCHLAITLRKIVVPNQLGCKVQQERMVEAIKNPGEERMHLEKDTFLSELIKLGISIEEAGRDELIKDSHDKWRKDGKEDVVK